MPLSPTDFYAYSRATGAPVAETPEERARQAPDVYAFRQAQLQGPQQSDQGGFNVLDALGKTALAAGALAGGFGLYRGLRGKGLGQAVEGAVERQSAKTTAQARQPVQRVANTKLGIPYGENPEYLALFNERGFPIDLKLAGPTPSPQRAVAQVAAEPKPNLGVQVTNLNTPTRVSAPLADPWDSWQGALEITPIPTEAQLAAPVAQERMVRRHGRMVPLSSVSTQTPLANRSPQSFLTEEIQSVIPSNLDAATPVAQERMVRRHGRMVPLSSVSNQTPLPNRSPQSFLTEEIQSVIPNGPDAGDRFIEEYAPEYEKLVRGQARQDSDVARRVRAHQMQVQGKAERILADIKQEALAESKAPSQAFLQAETQPNEQMLNRLVAEHAQGTAENIAGQLAGETLVDQHNTQISQHAYQSVSAVNSAEDQMTGRVKHSLQQNPDLDLSQVEVLEDMAQHSYQQGMEQPGPYKEPLYPKYDSSENYPNDQYQHLSKLHP